MKKKTMIKSRAAALVFGFMLVCLGVSNGYGSVCSEGTAEPPFLNTGVDPNLLLILDNSASMYDLAFVEDAKYCYDDTYDPTANVYSGFFDPDKWYAYETDKFVEITDTAASTLCGSSTYQKTIGGANDICLTLSGAVFSKIAAKGHYLNWAAVSKMDIEKEILTGGKFDTVNSTLQMESRGCLERRFIKKTDFDSGDQLTLAVRPPEPSEQTSSDDHTSRIEIYPVTATGYEHGACQQAVEEMQNPSPSLGKLKGFVDTCMAYDATGNSPEASSQAAFNHSVQDCWYIAKQGLDHWLQTSNGSITAIKNDCGKVYAAPLLPWDITTDHSGYVCYGDYLKPVTDPLSDRGYVGRCWSTGGGTGSVTCTDRVCNGEPTSGANPKCGANNKVYQCNGKYNPQQDTCKNDDWIVVQDCTGGGDPSTDWLSNDCVEQGLIDFCGTLDFPEVVDPSDQATGSGDATGEFWNLPAMLVDAGVGSQLGDPLLVMIGQLVLPETPTGLIQEFDTDIRIGAMQFNYDGAKSECDPIANPFVTYDCTNTSIRDGGQVVIPVGQGGQHSIDLVAAINGIDADTWTPLGEAMYNAVGYYRQDDSKQLDSADFDTTTDPITEWCQSNNILLVTDGAPTADQNSAMISFASGLGYNLGSGTCTELHGSTYLDDLSKYAYEDIWIDRTFTVGQERRPVSTHIVAAGKFRDSGADKCLPVNLLDAAATSGGTQLYQADDFSQLENALAAAFSNIRAGASAGSAASVISSSRGGEGAIYQAIFWPNKPSSDLTSTTKVKWAGEVHSLFIDASGFMYEDTDDNRQLTSDDKRVIIYFDNVDLVSKGCYVTPVNGSCSDSVDMDAIHYLWSAADWLAKISNSAFLPYDIEDQYLNRSSYISNDRRRYIFTWNDLDNNGIVDGAEVLPFVGWNSSSDTTGTDWVGMSTSGVRRSVPNDFNLADDGVANDNVNDIVTWIRGVEVNGSRSRTIAKKMAGVSPDPEVVWRLGDVIHSTPTAVSRPMENIHLLYQDATYAKFVGRWANRRSMVYFGANDGMLHAVNSGFYKESKEKFCLTSDCENETLAPELGAEMWAYVPYNLLPHLECLTTADYAHKYYVDQIPRVFDARIFEEEGVCTTSTLLTRDPGCLHPYGWGTVLVGSMRFGGAPVAAADLSGSPVIPADDERVFTSSYFVLDITNPEAPPVLLGELTRGANEANLGFTTSGPTAAVMKSDSGAGEWYLLMGSGPQAADSSNAIKGISEQKPKIAVFPLEGLTTAIPKMPFRIPDAEPTSTTAGVFTLTGSDNGFVSDMITVDYDLNSNYMSDAVYFGTVEHGGASIPPVGVETYDDVWDGKLYRLVMRGVDSASGKQVSTTPDEWYTSVLLDAGQPITAAPAVGTDLNRYWIYFGTGRFFDAEIDKPDDAQQSFYGVKEPINCTNRRFTWDTVTVDNLKDVSSINVTEGGDLTGGDTITGLSSLINHIAGSPGSCSTDAVDGWYRDFSSERPRERNVGQATLLGGLLTFTTYQPFDDPCLQDGEAYLYGLHYQSGTSSYKSVFGAQGLDGDRVKESISIGRGLATTPNLHVGKGSEGPTAFVQTSTGEIVELPQTNLPNSDFKTGRRGWLER